MIKNGIVSTINIQTRKAKVLLPEQNSITGELKIASSITDIQPNDNVIIALFDNGAEGIIIENLSRNSGQNNPGETYIHTQIAPTSLWVIQHNLNKFPSTTIVDSAGSEVIGDKVYVSSDCIEVTFKSAFAGLAFLN
jgi:hypothetical protein